MDDYDVVIVGAGSAGLMAARELADRGVGSLAIVEARDRIGGRTTGRPLAGYPDVHVELGGQFLRPFAQRNLRREIERYAIPMTRLNTGEDRVATVRFVMGGEARSGLPVPVGELHYLEKALVKMRDAARRISAALPYDQQDLQDVDVSFDEFFAPLHLPAASREFLYGVIGNTLQADPEQLSMLAFLPWAEAGGSFMSAFVGRDDEMFTHGSQSMTAALLEDARADLVLGSPVVEVVQEHGSVMVRTDRGDTFRGKACVMAMPSHLLADVRFAPALSAEKRDALAPDREYVIPGFKQFLIVEDAIPGLLGYAGFGHPDEPRIGCLFEGPPLPDGRTLLFAWGRGPRFDTTDEAQAALSVYMPEARVVALDGHDWARDPFSRGIFRLVTPGQGRTFASVMEAPEGQIRFAGTDIVTTSAWSGWIEGALESGRRAAELTYVSLRRASAHTVPARVR